MKPYLAFNLILLFLLINNSSISQSIAESAKKNSEISLPLLEKVGKNMQAWLNQRDPETGLLVRYMPEFRPGERLQYTVKDVPADLYPFLVLTSWFTDRELHDGYLTHFISLEKQLTTAEDGLPRDLFFGPLENQPGDRNSRIFGASEYVKDGLTPVLELLGDHNIWFDRMVELVEAIYENAPVKTRYGSLPSGSAEINGEMLQTLVRLYGVTRKQKYLDRARALGDAYCFEIMPGNHNLPVHEWDFESHHGNDQLRLRDHGCEIIGGLSLLLSLEHELESERAKLYYQPIKNMLARLELVIDEDGMFPNHIRCSDLEPIDAGLNDNWGYLYTAWYNFYLVSGDQHYKNVIKKALVGVNNRIGESWEGQNFGADGYADALEGALQMYNRVQEDKVLPWMETELQAMMNKQHPKGYIEGWYGDGNWNRTLIMYLLWNTRGTWLSNWNNVALGAAQQNDQLHVYLKANQKWKGKIHLDYPRHKKVFGFRENYARINEFPEWFTVERMKLYTFSIPGKTEKVYTGAELNEGIELELNKNQELKLLIKPCP
jgi:hypothetical protein